MVADVSHSIPSLEDKVEAPGERNARARVASTLDGADPLEGSLKSDRLQHMRSVDPLALSGEPDEREKVEAPVDEQRRMQGGQIGLG